VGLCAIPGYIILFHGIRHRARLGGSDGCRWSIQRHRGRSHEYGRRRSRIFHAAGFGYYFGKGSWMVPFFITSGVMLIGAVIWTFLINPEKSVVDVTY
jgi:hypothetical protein